MSTPAMGPHRARAAHPRCATPPARLGAAAGARPKGFVGALAIQPPRASSQSRERYWRAVRDLVAAAGCGRSLASLGRVGLCSRRAGSRRPLKARRSGVARRYREPNEERPVPEYLEEARRQGSAAIAVTGGPGVGKSSWINTMRRLPAVHPDAAPTGVNEARSGPQMYRFWKAVVRDEDEPDSSPGTIVDVLSKGPSEWEVKLPDGSTASLDDKSMRGVLIDCHLWDLPGVGTPGCPQGSYIASMGLAHFDMVLIVTASRFTESELLLATELRRLGVPFSLVRNKVDLDVQSEMERHEEEDSDDEHFEERRTEIEDRTLDRIRSFFGDRSLRGLPEETPIYCISSRLKMRDRFDFEQLEQDMEDAVRKHSANVRESASQSSNSAGQPTAAEAAGVAATSGVTEASQSDRTFGQFAIVRVDGAEFRTPLDLLDEYSSLDPYKVLGLPIGASPAQIRKAFVDRSKKYHPDVNGGKAGTEWALTEWAYGVLKDPDSRANYVSQRFLSSLSIFLEGAVSFSLLLWRALLEVSLQERKRK